MTGKTGRGLDDRLDRLRRPDVAGEHHVEAVRLEPERWPVALGHQQVERTLPPIGAITDAVTRAERGDRLD